MSFENETQQGLQSTKQRKRSVLQAGSRSPATKYFPAYVHYRLKAAARIYWKLVRLFSTLAGK